MAEKYFNVKNGLKVYADAVIDSDLTVSGNLNVTGTITGSLVGFDSDFNAKSTTDLSEGSNLYYTTARADSAFDVRLATKSTANVSEGSNLYYTTARADSDFDVRLATKSTTDVTEGNNLYYTQARFDSAIGDKTTNNLSEGSSNLYYTTVRFDSDLGDKTTGDLTEGVNKYYTQVRVDSDIDAKVDSAFVQLHFPEAVTLTDTQTLTNKTLTAPTVNTSITFDGGAVIHSQSNGGLSIGEDTQLSSTETVYNLAAQDSTKNVALAFGIPNLYHHSIRTLGTSDSNQAILGFEGANTTFKIASGVGTDPITNGTTLVKVSPEGRIHVSNTAEAASKTNASVTLTGGLGVDKNIRGQDIIASNNIQAVGGQLLGTLSAASLSARSTSDLSEGSNLYYTDARVDSYINASITTTDVSEGNNLYFTTARADSDAKRAVSVNDAGGDGSLSYNSSTGAITYTGPSAAETRAHFTGGTGVTITSGSVAIGQAVGTSDSVEFGGALLTGNVVIQGNLTVQGTQQSQSQADLSVSNAYITVADSNQGDAVDIGIVGSYSDDGGTTIRHTGFIRDASNGEWYTFDNLVQDTIDSSPRAQTINITDSTVELPTWNFGKLRGQYLGFDSDFAAFSSDYTVHDSDFTAVNAGRYAVDTSGGQVTVTLPASPATGDYVRLIDVQNFSTNSVIVARNGSTIEGYSDDFELDLGQSIIEFIYINSNWQVYSSIGQRGPAGADGASFDSAEFASQAQSIAFSVALG